MAKPYHMYRAVDVIAITTPSMRLSLFRRQPIVIELSAAPVASDGAWIVQGIRRNGKQFGERKWIAETITPRPFA